MTSKRGKKKRLARVSNSLLMVSKFYTLNLLRSKIPLELTTQYEYWLQEVSLKPTKIESATCLIIYNLNLSSSSNPSISSTGTSPSSKIITVAVLKIMEAFEFLILTTRCSNHIKLVKIWREGRGRSGCFSY